MGTDKIRVILNIVFMILAVVSVILYFVVEDFTTFIYVCAAALFVKLMEFFLRFMLYRRKIMTKEEIIKPANLVF